MQRRKFLKFGLTAWAVPFMASNGMANIGSANQAGERWKVPVETLASAANSGQVHAAALYIDQRGDRIVQGFGAAKSGDDIFLIASITKPICIVALMTLFEQKKIQLDDRVQRYLPEFSGESRDRITMRQLMTHVSGLPDQLPENAMLRRTHAPMEEFVRHAVKTPLLFEPGTKYSYSSMAILLAMEVSRRITGTSYSDFVRQAVFEPLKMQRSALGMGKLQISETMRCQTEYASPEAGAGDPTAKDWDWNSKWWREFGAPWGGVHSTASDLGLFFSEMLHPTGKVIAESTVSLMTRNHNAPELTAHGLGFGVGKRAGSAGCSERTFGHTGSTGTLAWADPETETICIVLTTLPVVPGLEHPRRRVSDQVAEIATF